MKDSLPDKRARIRSYLNIIFYIQPPTRAYKRMTRKDVKYYNNFLLLRKVETSFVPRKYEEDNSFYRDLIQLIKEEQMKDIVDILIFSTIDEAYIPRFLYYWVYECYEKTIELPDVNDKETFLFFLLHFMRAFNLYFCNDDITYLDYDCLEMQYDKFYKQSVNYGNEETKNL